MEWTHDGADSSSDKRARRIDRGKNGRDLRLFDLNAAAAAEPVLRHGPLAGSVGGFSFFEIM
jgi:hypothetical protein